MKALINVVRDRLALWCLLAAARLTTLGDVYDQAQSAARIQRYLTDNWRDELDDLGPRRRDTP